MSNEISRGFRIWLWMLLFGIGMGIIWFFYDLVSDRFGILGLIAMVIIYVFISFYAIGYGANRTDN